MTMARRRAAVWLWFEQVARDTRGGFGLLARALGSALVVVFTMAA